MATVETDSARDIVLLRDAGALLAISPHSGIVWHDSELAEGTLVWRPTNEGGDLVLRGARLLGETDEVTRDARRDVRILQVTHSPAEFVRLLGEGDVQGAVNHLLEVEKQARRSLPHPLRLFLRRIRARIRGKLSAARGNLPFSYKPVIVVAKAPIEAGEEAVSTSSEEHSPVASSRPRRTSATPQS